MVSLPWLHASQALLAPKAWVIIADIIGMLLLLSSVLADMKLHCAAPASDGPTAGAIIGLTSDNTYNIRLPADAPANEEKWTRVDHNSPPATMAAVNGSFTGSYMQVLPDDRDSYYQIHGEGSFTMTGLEYVIDIATAGKHTLYLRWSAGDDRGAGDSLYVVMREYATDHIVPGESTLKTSLEAIDAVPGKFEGCCYNHATHACVCYALEQSCESWQPTARAAHWATCPVGAGQMDVVTDPLWYLYSGKTDPTAVSFAAEPWDATCEAAGTGTHDTSATNGRTLAPVASCRSAPHNSVSRRLPPVRQRPRLRHLDSASGALPLCHLPPRGRHRRRRVLSRGPRRGASEQPRAACGCVHDHRLQLRPSVSRARRHGSGPHARRLRRLGLEPLEERLVAERRRGLRPLPGAHPTQRVPFRRRAGDDDHVRHRGAGRPLRGRRRSSMATVASCWRHSPLARPPRAVATRTAAEARGLGCCPPRLRREEPEALSFP